MEATEAPSEETRPMAQPPATTTSDPCPSSEAPAPPSFSHHPSPANPNPNPKTLTPLLQPESQPHHHPMIQPPHLDHQDPKQHQQADHDHQFPGFQSNRPPSARHWQRPSHMSPFQPHHLPSPSSSASPSPSAPPPTAIGLPAIRPPQPPNAFSPSFRHSMGMIGSQMQPHQHRPQLSYRPQPSLVNQPSPSQSFQGQGITRPSSLGSQSTAVTSTSQGPSPQNQAWLPSVPHGRPPMAISPRPPLNPQQKSQMTPQSHHPMSPALQQQQQLLSSNQQQQPPAKSSNQQRDHLGQQFSAPRNAIPQPSSTQQARSQGAANQKSLSTAPPQPSTVQPVTNDIVAAVEIDESNKRIIGKRSIQELVNQIDPSEKLDPEVEDILIDIAEEFVESITTFGCSLAKHRQSSTLEAKDILLHLERNWNMTLPGFGGDEIKTFKKPSTNDLHRERLTVVRKSIAGADSGNTKISAGQASANAKGHLAKALPNASGP